MYTFGSRETGSISDHSYLPHDVMRRNELIALNVPREPHSSLARRSPASLHEYRRTAIPKGRDG